MLTASEVQGTLLVAVGSVMGRLGALALAGDEGVRIGVSSTRTGFALAGGNIGAVECAGGGGRCGAGGNCAGY